jgi:hypothetical protein
MALRQDPPARQLESAGDFAGLIRVRGFLAAFVLSKIERMILAVVWLFTFKLFGDSQSEPQPALAERFVA